jgi:valyl-tRNA synthetase
VPEKPSLEGLEAKWSARWEEAGTYRFDRSVPRSGVFSIDTPPPTVSGELHIGHVFSYTHTDTVARYRRMRGYEVFYPMGFDDNGLPTERRVQQYYGVLCDPGLRKDPDFVAPEKPRSRPVAISRPDFIELCTRLAGEDEKVFENLWRTLGLSVDWTTPTPPSTTGPGGWSQQGFLHLLTAGHAYSREAPTQWDVDFQTAVSQAEMEEKEVPGAYHRLTFSRADGGGDVEIETTRPELLAACVALVAHPDDERYQAAVRHRRAHSSVQGPGPDPGPRAGRSREGLGDGHDLHLRRHHRRHLVARPGPAHADDHRAQRSAPTGELGRAGMGEQ